MSEEKKSKQREYDDRKIQAGMLNVRVWIWHWQRDQLLNYAERLRKKGEKIANGEDIGL
jgi:hypothetical protein